MHTWPHTHMCQQSHVTLLLYLFACQSLLYLPVWVYIANQRWYSYVLSEFT